MSAMPKVSVIIPVYNVETFIADTIQSVLNQTFDNFEIIIVVDGSPDNSVAVCRQFTDPRIQIIEQENRGLAGARNTGLRSAKGEYIAFLDGDDQWEPEKLARHLQHLEQFPQVGVSFSRSKLFGGNSAAYLMSYTGDVDGKRLLCRNPISNGSTPVLRRLALEEVRVGDTYFDESFRRAEDLDLWLRIASLTSWKFEGLPEPLTRYRVNGEGLSANYYKQLESWDQVAEKARSYAPELIDRWGKMGRAYLLRALAQKAIMINDHPTAVRLINQAMQTDLGILLEPRGTLMTVFAAYLLRILPAGISQPLLAVAFQIRTWSQQQQLRSEGSQVVEPWSMRELEPKVNVVATEPTQVGQG